MRSYDSIVNDLYYGTDEVSSRAHDECSSLNPLQAHFIYKQYGRKMTGALVTSPIPLSIWAVAHLTTHFSKAVMSGIQKLENKIGKRPALKAAASIEVAFGWTPDPASEIIAGTLAASSVACFGLEKVFGKDNVDKVLNIITQPFTLVAKKLPSPSVESQQHFKNKLSSLKQAVITGTREFSNTIDGAFVMRTLNLKMPQ